MLALRVAPLALLLLVDRGAADDPPRRRELLPRLWPAGVGAVAGEERIRRHVATPPFTADQAPSPAPPAVLTADAEGTVRGVTPHPGQRPVALTFDLCESAGEAAGYQGDIVDLLRAQGTPATFFAGGQWMRTHPERTLQLMADPLFELGSHGWSHRNLRTADAATIVREVAWPQQEYARLREELVRRVAAAGLPAGVLDDVPAAPRLFRFPFGSCRPEALAAVAAQGLRAVQWTVVAGDPSPQQTAAGIERIVLGAVQPGAIVVFHANGRAHGTHDALAQVIPALRARGYEFVRVSDLLGPAIAERPITARECYELRPGDTARYDRLGR